MNIGIIIYTHEKDRKSQ